MITRDGGRAELAPVHPAGVFEGRLAGASLPLDYELEVDYGDDGTYTVGDPYRFLPTLGDMDLHLAGEGRHEELYAKLGAHVVEHQGVQRHRVRGLGAERAGGLRGRRLQLLGRPAAPDAVARLERDLGAVPARRRLGHELQVRDPRRDGARSG